MKLELKHIAPYYIYNVKCMYIKKMPYGDFINVIDGIASIHNGTVLFPNWHDHENINDIKPILHPLSEYNKGTGLAIKNKLGCDLFNVHEIWKLYQGEIKLDEVTYSTYKVMCRNLIDFNNLINEGLAIDINTLEK